MTTTMTMRELKQLIEDGCDFSQPLRVVSRDVGKNAAKHSAVRVDENFPVRLTVASGTWDDRGSLEFAHYSGCEVLMPEALIDAIDDVLEEKPLTFVKWAYFFYFPLDYVTRFKRTKHIECCLLDTSNIHKIYLADDEPNTLVIEGDYTFGSFE